MSSSSPRSTSTPSPRSFYLESLGCAKNQVDAEVMIAALERAGFRRAAEPAEAGVIIVNTCGFISAAKKESIETTLELRERNPGARVVMAGCLAGRYTEQLKAELPEIDGFAGPQDPASIVALVRSVLGEGPTAAAEAPARPYERSHLLSVPGSAYVKIAEGCDHRCTYCAIPLIRGRLSSRPRADVVAEIRGLLGRGIRELILIAQDLAFYGRDRGGAELPALLEEIAALPGDFWVRLLYIHPDNFPLSILDLCARDARFLPYFDIPFQHASPSILRAMGRRSDTAANLELVRRIRESVPRAVIRSTLLVGFPGETEDDISALHAFQDQARFDWLGVFAYSREEDTPAYRLGDRVPKQAAARRKALIEERQVPITEAALDARVGELVDVLVEEPVEGDEELSLGRSYLQAPDVDGLVVLTARRPAGALVRARVTRRNGVDLEAEAVDPFGAMEERPRA